MADIDLGVCPTDMSTCWQQTVDEGAVARYAKEGIAMVSVLLVSLGAAAVAFWGGMHIAKTRPVLAGFEPLSEDNRYVLQMEWLVEGVALIFTAILVGAATLFLGPAAAGARLIYGLSIGFLLTMAVVSLLTGAKASLLPYKLCAPIFTSAAVLIFLGGFAL